MPVFDFNATPDEKKPAECTYTVIRSNENEATIEKPMMILDNKQCKWEHHSCGVFTNPIKRTSFEFQQEDGTVSADILKIDARFVSLLKWLGENHINVRLSGENTEEGYAVYKIREIAFGGGTKLSAEDGFLQFMIERLLASNARAEEENDEDEDEDEDSLIFADGTPQALTLPAAGGEIDLAFSASGPWQSEITDVVEWIVLSQAAGEAGEQALKDTLKQ